MKNGKDGLKSLKDHFGDRFTLEDGLFQKTPTGGKHICFKYDEARPVGCGVEFLPGVDVRGDGGYIVVWPSSANVDGQWIQYEWKDQEAQPQEAPEWAYELLTLKQGTKSKISIADVLSTGISQGERDVSLFKVACLMEREGVDIDTALTFIEILAERCKPPFSKSDARNKVEIAYTDYATKKGLEARLEALQRKKESLNG